MSNRQKKLHISKETSAESGTKMTEFRAAKYSGGVYCGNGEFKSIQECIDFANDGFCDYVRISSDEISLKVKITASKKLDEIG